MQVPSLLTLCQLIALVQAFDLNPRESSSRRLNHILLLVHASTAVLAWVVFFPLGSILLRLIEGKNAFWVHVTIQSLATAMYIVAVGTGIHLAKAWRSLDVYHPVLGLTIFALVFIQIVAGIIHHLFFRKYLRRTVISYVHIWLGRILVTAGIINGGLGLLMAHNASKGQIAAYGVVAGIIWVVFIAVGFWKSPTKKKSGDGQRKPRSRRRRANADLGPPRRRERLRGSEKFARDSSQDSVLGS